MRILHALQIGCLFVAAWKVAVDIDELTVSLYPVLTYFLNQNTFSFLKKETPLILKHLTRHHDIPNPRSVQITFII